MGDVSRLYPEQQGTFAMMIDDVRGFQCRRRLECMLISEGEYTDVKCA
jgi:hypothetical protein